MGCRSVNLEPPGSGRRRLELCDSLRVRSIGQVVHRFPRIAGRTLPFPPNQIINTAANAFAFQELFHLSHIRLPVRNRSSRRLARGTLAIRAGVARLTALHVHLGPALKALVESEGVDVRACESRDAKGAFKFQRGQSIPISAASSYSFVRRSSTWSPTRKTLSTRPRSG